eukprot:3786358-Prorocentrum_lima.AAC.1
MAIPLLLSNATGLHAGGQSEAPESFMGASASCPTPTFPSRCPPYNVQSHRSPPWARPHTPSWHTPT